MSIDLIDESDAQGRVTELFDEIKSELGIDFVPNLYRAMAAKPALLDANWERTKTVMGEGRLDRVTKEAIAVAVSAVNACDY